MLNSLETLPETERLRALWLLEAREKQLPPEWDWFIWLILAGRGWGKTKTAAQEAADRGLKNAGWRIAVVARTYSDARDTCMEGETGLLSCLPERERNNWNRSLGELNLSNGTRYKLFTAEEPNRLRGPQHHFAYCDELASWQRPETWDQLMFGMRLGRRPQIVVATTPKASPLIKQLSARSGQDVALTVGATWENEGNLPPSAVAELKARYQGTRLGRQELLAEILEDVEGALWKQTQIDEVRLDQAPDMQRIVVAIDPAVTSGETSDDTGIVVAGKGVDGHGYVLADRTCHLTPDGWAKRAIAAYHEFKADRIVAEKNNGGDMVELTLRTADPNVPVTLVNASRGKIPRAEPVAALYEQKKIHHIGILADLESQMTTWVLGDKSPDRMDALVWAISELMVSNAQPTLLGSW